MGRVSLTEDYDDRSVIAKLNEMDKRVKENTTVVTSAEASAKASAQAAQETADRFAGSVGAVVQNANAQINASKAQVDQAKAEVDETVTTVAQAVQTANNASASAQQSANTVATYDTRLTAAESKNDQQDTDIGALQTADTKNVKIDIPQNITGRKTIVENYPRIDFKSKLATDVGSGIRLLDTADGSQKHYLYMYPDRIDIPSPAQGAPSSAIVNKAYVESTDGVTNNLVHRTTNETINGQKTFVETIIGIANKKILENTSSITVNKYLVWKFPKAKIEAFRGRAVLLFLGRTRLTMALGSLYYHSNGNDITFGGVTLLPGGNNAEFTVSSDDTYMYICQKGTGNIGQDTFKVAIAWAVDFSWKIDYNPEGEPPVLMDAIPGTTHGSIVIE